MMRLGHGIMGIMNNLSTALHDHVPISNHVNHGIHVWDMATARLLAAGAMIVLLVLQAGSRF